ncbi:hypothetical protein M0R01_03860 [bacterium]|nr:hypothetical protein [bacterium]
MARDLALNNPSLKILQDSVIQNPKYQVLVKPSHDSGDEEYVDITEYITVGSIERNIEGEPCTASITVSSKRGEFDICNLNSLLRNTFKDKAMVKISLGMGDITNPDNLLSMFTGYVASGYDQEYIRREEETVTIPLQDRSCFLDSPITTDQYLNTDLETVLDDVLKTYGGLSADEIGDISTLASYTVPMCQFTDETIWDIVNMICQVAIVLPYFDEDGVLRVTRIPMTITGTDTEYYVWDQLKFQDDETAGTPTLSISHSWNNDSLRSKITTIGGIKSNEWTGGQVPVIDVDPNFVGYALGLKPDFEATTTLWYGSLGNPCYDCLSRDPSATGDDRYFGAGFQGTIVPIYFLNEGETIEDDYLIVSQLRKDPDNWALVVQGPFPWTRYTHDCQGDGPGIRQWGCRPAEPYQTVQTGIGDGGDLGTSGYFSIYNTDGGTTVQIDVSTLSNEMTWCEYPVQRFFENGWGDRCVDLGIVPSKDEWDSFMGIMTGNGQPGSGVPYPFDPEDYDGPTSTEFYVYALTFLAIHSGRDFNWAYGDYDYRNKIFRWGGLYLAGEFYPETSYTGSAVDAELDAYYGESRYEEVENPLLWDDNDCNDLATSIIDSAKIFYLQTKVTRPLNFEIEPGDNILYLNVETGCEEKACITRVAYNFGNRSDAFTTEAYGGILDIDGTVIKTWV